MKWWKYKQQWFCNNVIKQKLHDKPVRGHFCVPPLNYFTSHHRTPHWATVQTNHAICVHRSHHHTLHEVEFHLEELLTDKTVLETRLVYDSHIAGAKEVPLPRTPPENPHFVISFLVFAVFELETKRKLKRILWKWPQSCKKCLLWRNTTS